MDIVYIHRFTVADLNPRTINIIQRVYKKDFELFGYSLAPEDSKNGPVMAVLDIAPVSEASTSDTTENVDKEDKKRDSTETSVTAAEVNGAEMTGASDDTGTKVSSDEDKPSKKQKV